MASTPERQSSFDDAVEAPGAVPLAYPLLVSAAFTDREPKVTIARAFRVNGGGSITVKTAAGVERTLAGLEDPFYSELKITEVVTATSATKIRFYA